MNTLGVKNRVMVKITTEEKFEPAASSLLILQ